MKLYLSIPKMQQDTIPNVYFYCFQKIDGSNIRAEWNSKKGFYKFGTRLELMDENSKPFGQAISLIKEKYEKDLTEIFKEQQWRDALCFFEFYGPSSFAGTHNFQEKMNVILLDVNPYKQGIMMPSQFIKLFGHLDIPKVCYEGFITTELFDKIKQSTLPGMTFEGIVAKADNDKATKAPIMFKIKSKAWLQKLKEYCKDDQKLFEKLS